MSGYAKCFDEVVFFNERWKMLKGFDSEPVYNEKYLKTKIKSYGEKINTNFHDNGVPREGTFVFVCH